MSTPAEPEVFGKYQLLEKIATGGMAEVWRARAHGISGFEKILVIKKVLPDLAKDEEFVNLFIDEARIAVSLLHGNIVQVFDLNRVDDRYFMAMEYVHGLDLARLITRARNLGAFPIPLALFVVAEVLKALQFAHDRRDGDGNPLNIVHCDISPQNVLVSYAGEVKLTDFGISRAAFQAQSLHKVIRGKYAYMSPEQVEGQPLDRRTDLFSLGIVLYEMVTGRRLFKAKKREQTLDRVRRAEVPSPRAYRQEISEGLESILLKALERRPENRFQKASEFLAALNRLMVGEGHRATNTDVATYLKAVIDAASANGDARGSAAPFASIEPVSVVVLAAEASPPPRSLALPQITLDQLSQRWAQIVYETGGSLWERGDGAILVVWTADDGLPAAVRTVVSCARKLQNVTVEAGYRLSAGVSPGVARIAPDTRRSPDGWELAGPFYLARWMMNLSAHRGRILLTEVGAKEIRSPTTLLGRIPIRGANHINLYELG